MSAWRATIAVMVQFVPIHMGPTSVNATKMDLRFLKMVFLAKVCYVFISIFKYKFKNGNNN